MHTNANAAGHMKLQAAIRKLRRVRSQNWLEKDKRILLALVKERMQYIEKKNTDSESNAEKMRAWRNLQLNFAKKASFPRTVKQLKAQWRYLKMNSRKRVSANNNETLTAMGGSLHSESDASSDNHVSVFSNHKEELAATAVGSPPSQSDASSDNDVSVSGNYKEELTKTAGNQPSASDSTSNNDISVMWLPDNINTDLNECDSDQVSKTVIAQQLAKTEIACRRDLHKAQLKNERQKFINLQLEEELLRTQIMYYKNKNN